MSNGLFEVGGPHDIRRTGDHEYSMRVSIPADAQGMVGRECPSVDCSPAYFKVKPGTGITGEAVKAYCPYCRHEGEPSDFGTDEQLRYAKDVLSGEVEKAASRMIEKALGLGPTGRRKFGDGMVSVEVSHKAEPNHYVRPPVEEELRRDVTCPHCGLVHSVFGLAVWCPDCGADIFLSHVETECGIVRTMLGDVVRRNEALGPRVAARDIENALEDTVSIFEATFRAMTARCLKTRGSGDADVEEVMRKRVGNRFQNTRRARDLVRELLDVDLYEGQSESSVEELRLTFEKRHPITHNLGVVDRKYLEHVTTGDKQGRDIRVSVDEVHAAISVSLAMIKGLYALVFPASESSISKQ